MLLHRPIAPQIGQCIGSIFLLGLLAWQKTLRSGVRISFEKIATADGDPRNRSKHRCVSRRFSQESEERKGASACHRSNDLSIFLTAHRYPPPSFSFVIAFL